MKRLAALAVFATLLAAPAALAGYEDKKPEALTDGDAEAIRTKSPWTTSVNVFPNALLAPDDKISKPISATKRVPVYVSWFSSGIFRHAWARLFENLSPERLAELTAPQDRFYLIRVSAEDALTVLDSPSDAELAKETRLEVDGTPYALSHVERPKQRGGRDAIFAFERGAGIPADAKHAVFVTKAHGLSIKAKFRVDKMTWLGKRDLDGDLFEPTPQEAVRRGVQAAVLGKDAALSRAVPSVRVQKLDDADRPWGAYIVYDVSRETAETKPDALKRKFEIASRLGEWSLANGTDLQAIVFLDPATNQAVDFVLAKDAEKLAKMKPEGGFELFKKKLTSAGEPAKDAGETGEGAAKKPAPSKKKPGS